MNETKPRAFHYAWIVAGVTFLTLIVSAGVRSAPVSNRWFVRRRGLVVGLLAASNASGQLIFLPLLAWLVSTFGWQTASYTTAIAVLAVVPVVAIFMRNYPRDLNLQPYAAT